MTRQAILGLAAILTVACGGRSCSDAPQANAATAISLAAQAVVNARDTGPGLKRPLDDAHALPVQRSLDLSHIDPARYAEALGRDPVRIFEFVRDQIAYEPYAGCLRGARGTLMSMAGNSVDRALLLASMLGATGERVRYVRGALPEPLAEVLVKSIWAERPWIATRGAEASPEAVAAGTRMAEWVKRDAALVRDSLESSGFKIPESAQPTRMSLVSEARDHYWVQWLNDGVWTDLDPSFASAVPGGAYANREATFDQLPETLYHRFELHVRVEEYAGDEPVVRDVLQYAIRSADLSGVDLFLTHEAEDPKNAVSRVRPRLAVPGQEVVGEWFSLLAPRQSAGETMLGGLGGDEGQAPLAASESVEIEFVAPDGRKDRSSREIFDRIGQAQRRTGARSSFDEVAARAASAGPGHGVGLYDFFITTGSLDPVHAGSVKALKTATEAPSDIRDRLRTLARAFVGVSDALTSRISGDGWTCRFYPDTPRVHIADVTIKGRALRVSLDLRRSTAREVATGLSAVQAFRAQVARGVVEGSLERTIVQSLARPHGREAFSTSLVFERASAAGVPAVLLSDPSASDVSGTDDGRARLESALASGSLVIAPREGIEIDGARRLAWWEVNRRTGMTTAVTDEGLYLGQLVEYGFIVDENGTTMLVLTVGGSSIATVGISSPAVASLVVAGLMRLFPAATFVFTNLTMGP